MKYFSAFFWILLALSFASLLCIDHWVSYLYFFISLPLLIPLLKATSLRDQVQSGNFVGVASSIGLKSAPLGRIMLLIEIITLPLTWIKSLVTLAIAKISIPKGAAGPPQTLGIYIPPTILLSSSYLIVSGVIFFASLVFDKRPSDFVLIYLGICCILSSFTLNVISPSYKRTLLNPKVNAVVSMALMSTAVILAFYMLQEKRDQTHFPSIESLVFLWSFVTMKNEIVYFQSLVAGAYTGTLSFEQVFSLSSLWATFFILAALTLDYFVVKQAYKGITVKRSDADKSSLVNQCLYLMALQSAQKIIDEGFDSKDIFLRCKIQLLFLSGDVIGLQNFLAREGFKVGKLSEKDRAFVLRALIETPDLNQFSDMSRFFDAILTLGFKRAEVVLFVILIAWARLHSGAIPIGSKVTRANAQEIPFFDILARAWAEDVTEEFLESVDSDSFSDIDDVLKVGVSLVLISIDGVSDKMSIENSMSIFDFMSERRGALAIQIRRNKPSGLIEYYATIANSLQTFLKMKHRIEDDDLREAIELAIEHASSEGRKIGNLDLLNKFIEKNMAN